MIFEKHPTVGPSKVTHRKSRYAQPEIHHVIEPSKSHHHHRNPPYPCQKQFSVSDTHMLWMKGAHSPYIRIAEKASVGTLPLKVSIPCSFRFVCQTFAASLLATKSFTVRLLGNKLMPASLQILYVYILYSHACVYIYIYTQCPIVPIHILYVYRDIYPPISRFLYCYFLFSVHSTSDYIG